MYPYYYYNSWLFPTTYGTNQSTLDTRVCAKHTHEYTSGQTPIKEIMDLVKAYRGEGICCCCGNKYKTGKTYYYSSDKPPEVWEKEHRTCCKF